MSKKIVKFCLITTGLTILISCVVGEVDGIGRAAMIFSGIAFVYVGAYFKKI